MDVRVIACALLASVGVARTEQVVISVSDGSSGARISEAAVSLTRGGRRVSEMQTDASGIVILSGLMAGNYVLRVQKSGFVDVLDSAGGGRIIGIDSSSVRVEVRLCRPAAISGTVRDHDGRALSGTRVLAIVRRGVEGRFASYGDAAHTDDLGRYRLFGLPPGYYSVVAAPAGGDVTTASFAPAYHGSVSPPMAVFFQLRPGETRTTVDVVLPVTQRLSVSGRVSGIPSDDVPRRAAVALATQAGLTLLVSFVFTDSDGAFHMADIPAGFYRLIAWAPATGFHSLATDLRSAKRTAIEEISVSGSDLPVAIALNPTVVVAGQLVWEGERTGACRTGEVVFVSEDGLPGEWTAAVAPAGDHITIPIIPAGRYKISFRNSPGPCSLAEVRSANRLALDHIVELNGPADLTLVLTDRTGNVSGSVGEVGGASPTGIVILLPVENGRSTQTGSIQPDGSYRLSDVQPGRYRLLATRQLNLHDYLDAEEAARLGVKLVVVEPDRTVTADLTLVQR